ncbi:MAG TPA: hypothetical protein VJP80_07320 [Candidatus Saccharimonadales bacterium]|nr:hypothetical protein [Candidatus Saccharimonadales bacterium]
MGENSPIESEISAQAALLQREAEEALALEVLWALPASEVDQTEESAIAEQAYANSQLKTEALGAAALAGVLGTIEGARLKETAKEDFVSSVVEMLNSDSEFRDQLEVSRERSYIFRDGHAMTVNNKGQLEPIVHMVRRGAKRSELAVKADPRMRFQAERDHYDVEEAERVDALAPGEFYLSVSMDPKQAFEQHGKDFVEGLGYRKGWGSLRWYWRHPDGRKLTAGTYTFNDSTMSVMASILRRQGVPVPANVTEDTFIGHALQTQCQSVVEARAIADTIRTTAYLDQNIVTKRHSVDDFIAQNEAVVNQVFDSQQVALAMAHKTKRKNAVVHTLAEAMMATPDVFRARTRQQLAEIHTKQVLNDSDIRLIGYIIRYGLVERLRPALMHVGGPTATPIELFIIPANMRADECIAQRLAENAQVGFRAGRTYGGCTAEVDLANHERDPENSPQDAFGGKDSSETEKAKWVKGVCRIDNCPTRPGTTMVGPCSVCWKCQKKYDNGEDPIEEYTKLPKEPEPTTAELAGRVLMPFASSRFAERLAKKQHIADAADLIKT